MATSNYNFQTISDDQTIDIVNAVNTPVTQIDTALNNEATARQNSDANINSTLNSIAPLDSTPTQNSTKGVTSGGVFTAIRQRHIMLAFGDSFGVDSETSPTWWHTVVANAMGLIDKNFCVGGTGFANPQSSTTFATEVITASNDSSFNNADVELIVCYGGLNDVHCTTESAITNGIQSFCTNCHTYFPNAKLVIAGPTTWNVFYDGPSYNNAYGNFECLMSYLLREGARNGGYAYINTTHISVGHTNFFYNNASTGVGDHFSVAGSKNAGAFIASSIMGTNNFTSAGSLTGHVYDNTNSATYDDNTWYIATNGSIIKIWGYYVTSVSDMSQAELSFVNSSNNLRFNGTNGGIFKNQWEAVSGPIQTHYFASEPRIEFTGGASEMFKLELPLWSRTQFSVILTLW